MMRLLLWKIFCLIYILAMTTRFSLTGLLAYTHSALVLGEIFCGSRRDFNGRLLCFYPWSWFFSHLHWRISCRLRLPFLPVHSNVCFTTLIFYLYFATPYNWNSVNEVVNTVKVDDAETCSSILSIDFRPARLLTNFIPKITLHQPFNFFSLNNFVSS